MNVYRRQTQIYNSSDNISNKVGVQLSSKCYPRAGEGRREVSRVDFEKARGLDRSDVFRLRTGPSPEAGSSERGGTEAIQGMLSSIVYPG